MIHPACAMCKGACCETIMVDQNQLSPDTAKWFSYHGNVWKNWVELQTPCQMLVDGKCSIYETRPEMCKEAVVGGLACILSIRRRRPQIEKELMELVKVAP